VNTPENSNMASPSAPAGAGVDWEARYTAGDTPWDKGTAHPGLIRWLAGHSLTGRILVPGCGSGHDVRAIAASGNAEVLGFDIAPSALDLAKKFPPSGYEKYILGDFLAGEATAHGPFDAIFEHTCFCAIHPSRRTDYVRAASAALKPGGLFLAVFFRNPENPDPHSPPFACGMDEVDSLFGGDFTLMDSSEPLDTYPERIGREVLRVYRKK
jgi:SAM-dependent methyltransferase